MSFRIPQYTRLNLHASSLDLVNPAPATHQDRRYFVHDDHSKIVQLDTLDGTDEISGNLYIPDGYEPNYAYPLLVWLNPQAALADIMSRLSTRNYLALAYRWDCPRKNQSSADLLAQGYINEDHSLAHSIRMVCQHLNVHRERIFLAGQHEAATLALDLLLHKPEWFSGAICLQGSYPRQPHALMKLPQLAGKQIFQQFEPGLSGAPSAVNRKLARLLFAAGMDVHSCLRNSRTGLDNTIFREIDSWMMKNIATTQHV